MRQIDDLNNLKSEFGVAYVRAIAHAAGFFTQETNRLFDLDGVDLTIMNRGAFGVSRSPKLDVQVKVTKNLALAHNISFDLEVKNYNELCDSTFQVPRVLVVVHVPEAQDAWISDMDEGSSLRYCCYWLSLHGKSPSENDATQRVIFPKGARFNVASLQLIMQRVRVGQAP